MRSIGRKIGVSGGLPGRANATIRSPAVIGIKSPGSGFGTAPSQPQSVDLPGVFVCDHSETAMPRPVGRWQGGRSRSLRLSVRTPPFHGGESGSIPLGSASALSIILYSLLILKFSPNFLGRFGKLCSLCSLGAWPQLAVRPSSDQLRACSFRPASGSCGQAAP